MKSVAIVNLSENDVLTEYEKIKEQSKALIRTGFN